MFKKFVMIALVTLIAACSQTRHYVNGDSIEGTRRVKDNTDYFISGLGQKEHVSASDLCGGKSGDVIATETYGSPLNKVLGAITWGIYTPEERTVYCRNAQ